MFPSMFPSKFEDGLVFFLPVFPTPMLLFPRESEDEDGVPPPPPPPLAAPGRFILFLSLSLARSSGPPLPREREKEEGRSARGRSVNSRKMFSSFSIFRVSLIRAWKKADAKQAKHDKKKNGGGRRTTDVPAPGPGSVFAQNARGLAKRRRRFRYARTFISPLPFFFLSY